MIQFLQQNAEWICAIAIVIFTAAQCWISHSQFKQELRFRRFDLAHQMDEACIIYKFDKESIHKIADWFNRNQSQFMYLLNEKDLRQTALTDASFENIYKIENVDEIDLEPCDWHLCEKEEYKKLSPWATIKHYMLVLTNGYIPPEYITLEVDNSKAREIKA